MDDEVAQLEAKVEEASRRLAATRAGMQAQLTERLAAKLAQCRPSAAVEPPRTDAEPPVGDTAEPPSPRAEELAARLAEAATKLPTLRARLEGADGRLQRVLAAVTSDLQRPPPNTVERLVMGRPSLGPAEQADASLSKALQAGAISTRRGRESTKAAAYVDDDEAEEEGEAAGQQEAEREEVVA